MNPLVTCLCLTKDRREWLPKAIACFQEQTYPDRELLIVADGESVKDLLPDEPRIRLIEVESPITIGAKRNIGVVRARGRFIAHWDDDDYSAPGRLDDQVGRLLSSGLAVTGYNTMRFTDGTNMYLYTGNRDYALGTSFCYSREWALAHPFPDKQRAEDNAFVQMAAKEKQLTCVPCESLMSAAIHPGNTSYKRAEYYQKL